MSPASSRTAKLCSPADCAVSRTCLLLRFKGIRILSSINTVILIGFLLFIFATGATGFILKFGMEGFGYLLSHFFESALFTGAAHQDLWPTKWTMMHFANWFAWAPIMGVFLGRIAYGYTVRAYLLFNVVLPRVKVLELFQLSLHSPAGQLLRARPLACAIHESMFSACC